MKQEANFPTVYLDTWAFNVFSSEEEKGVKFVEILSKKKGTVLISVLSLLEICNKEDISHFKLIFDLLDGIDFVFIELSPKLVISEEDKKITNFSEYGYSSPATPSFIVDFVLDPKHKPPYKISDAFWTLKNEKDELNSINEIIKKEIMRLDVELIELRNNEAKKQELEENIKYFKKNPSYELPLTRILWDQCLSFLIKNRIMKMKKNDWLDILHTIVPVAYAEFVLLDKRWFNFINQTGLNYPHIAKVYTYKYLNDFFTALEDYYPQEKWGQNGGR